MWTDTNLYDLSKLKNMQGDWRVRDSALGSIYFNFCRYADQKSCEYVAHDSFGYATKNGVCQQLTSDSPRSEVTSEISRPNEVDELEDQTGLRSSRAGGSKCPEDNARSLQITFDIWCDPRVKNEPSNLKVSRLDPNGVDDPCEIYISMEHSAGCVVYDVHPILRIFGTAMIFVGVMLYFFSI